MGRISAPFGITGRVRIQPFSATTGSLLAYCSWWVGRDADWREYRIQDAEIRGRVLVAKLEHCDDRDAAMRLRGQQIGVPRSALPQPGANEYYWADLIGLRVVNGEARDFGRVARILETGANEVLVVQGERERLIPFIGEVIGKVDLASGTITVDWSADY